MTGPHGSTVRRALGALLVFAALNAFSGGYYGLSGAPGVPREWLAGSPFTDYRLPSPFLFVVVGGSCALAAGAVLARFRWGRVAAALAGAILLVWIVVQVAIIGYVSWMQPVTSIAALIVLVLAWRLPATTDRPRAPS